MARTVAQGRREIAEHRAEREQRREVRLLVEKVNLRLIVYLVFVNINTSGNDLLYDKKKVDCWNISSRTHSFSVHFI